MNTTSTLSNLTHIAKFFYQHNKKQINIHTITNFPNVLVSFNIGNKNLFTNIHSLLKIIFYLIHIDIIENMYNNNNDYMKIKLFKIKTNINNLLYINKIDYEDLKFFYNNNIIVKILYNYIFSKDSLHGYTNMYLENILDRRIINLSNYDRNIIVYLQTENVYIYKTSLKKLINILELKSDGKKIIKNNNEKKNNQKNNIKLKLYEDIDNNNIYDLFIYSPKF